MKYKKYIIGLFLGLVILLGGGSIASASSVITTGTTLTPTNTGNLDLLIIYNNAGDTNLTQMAPANGIALDYLLDLGLTQGSSYKYVYTKEVYPAQYNACYSTSGGTYASCIAQNGNALYGSFTVQSAPTGGTGISLFKSGGYQASDMLGQTATALQSTMGLNGLGKMIAIVVGISLALMLGLWINGLFGEAKKGLKDDKKLK